MLCKFYWIVLYTVHFTAFSLGPPARCTFALCTSNVLVVSKVAQVLMSRRFMLSDNHCISPLVSTSVHIILNSGWRLARWKCQTSIACATVLLRS